MIFKMEYVHQNNTRMKDLIIFSRWSDEDGEITLPVELFLKYQEL